MYLNLFKKLLIVICWCSLAGRSPPRAAQHLMWQVATNPGFLDLRQPQQVRGLRDAVGGLFLRIRSSLPTEQLAACHGWLKNLSAKAKLSFAALRVRIWGGPLRARQASAVRGEGRTPAKGPREQPSPITQSVFVCRWIVLRSKQLGNNGFITLQQPFVDLGLALLLSRALLG